MNGKLNSISLFSGYAGLDLALQEYCRPILYCDIERYSQAMLLSRMDDGLIPFAPIWNDVTTLDGTKFTGMVDAIVGGFPCQDISTAGKGAGLEGKRSGLFYEVVRLTKEIQPSFVFLENVPAIRTRGLEQVIKEFTQMGYDCRWTMLSASSVGANHQRERWFFLANSNSSRQVKNTSQPAKRDSQAQSFRPGKALSNTMCERLEGQRITSRVSEELHEPDSGLPLCKHCRGSEDARKDREDFEKKLAHTNLQGQCRKTFATSKENNQGIGEKHGWPMSSTSDSSWWETEPSVGRVVDGTTFRVDRIKALGNGVVPLQAKVAFERLMGIYQENEKL